ncbi:MAG: cellulase family glycosylhydrolase [Rhodospirillaceae bacterium]|nr:cellulase family glycosylhydrolase [Rhodospirillaceae bacterium]
MLSRRHLLKLLAGAGAGGFSAINSKAFGQSTLILPKINFWDRQRQGANFFHRDPREDLFATARNFGFDFVRLSFESWSSQHPNFLLGNTDHYRGLVEADKNHLGRILGLAQKYAVPILICPLTLPGSQFQANAAIDKEDKRLWQDPKFWQYAADYWRDLALFLRDHPIVYGYDLLNEPHPERLTKKPVGDQVSLPAWQQEYLGTTADLNLFYQLVIKHIRQVDSWTPIIIESGFDANPQAFINLEPVQDSRVLYSFHQYQPWVYTTAEEFRGQFCYPGQVTAWGQTEHWDKKQLQKSVAQVILWSHRNQIRSRQILIGEIGVHRQACGAFDYLRDNIAIFNEHGWHWAFYAFREDQWDGMDYELPVDFPEGEYWYDLEQGLSLPRQDTEIFKLLRKQF